MNWLTSRKTLWISGTLFIFSQGCILLILKGVDSPWNIIRQQTTFSPREFQSFLVAWGPEKTSQFLSHYYLDFLHPFVYSIFFASWLGRARIVGSYHWIFLLPILAGLFDEIENVMQIQITLGWLPYHSVAFYVGAVASNLKWIFATASIVALAVGFRRSFEASNNSGP